MRRQAELGVKGQGVVLMNSEKNYAANPEVRVKGRARNVECACRKSIACFIVVRGGLNNSASIAHTGVRHGHTTRTLLVPDKSCFKDAVRMRGAIGQSTHENADRVASTNGILGLPLIGPKCSMVTRFDTTHALPIKFLNALPNVLRLVVKSRVAEARSPVTKVRRHDEKRLTIANPSGQDSSEGTFFFLGKRANDDGNDLDVAIRKDESNKGQMHFYGMLRLVVVGVHGDEAGGAMLRGQKTFHNVAVDRQIAQRGFEHVGVGQSAGVLHVNVVARAEDDDSGELARIDGGVGVGGGGSGVGKACMGCYDGVGDGSVGGGGSGGWGGLSQPCGERFA